MAKPGPAAGSGKTGGKAVGKLGGRPRKRLIVEAELTAETLKTLKVLALAAGITPEAWASTALANAIEETWQAYDAEIRRLAAEEWNGEVL